MGNLFAQELTETKTETETETETGTETETETTKPEPEPSMNRAEEIVHRELHVQQKLKKAARARRWSMAKATVQLPQTQLQCQKDVVADNILVTNVVKKLRAHMLLNTLPIWKNIWIPPNSTVIFVLGVVHNNPTC